MRLKMRERQGGEIVCDAVSEDWRGCEGHLGVLCVRPHSRQVNAVQPWQMLREWNDES